MNLNFDSIARPGSALCRAVVVLMLAGGLLAGCTGCDPGTNGECTPACNSGEVCNRVTGECVPVRLNRFDGEVPGRNLSMTATQGRVFLGTVDPKNGYLLVGTLADSGPRMYILRQFQQVRDKSVAIASNDTLVVVGWLDDNDRYRLATHRLDGEADRWRTVPLKGAATLNYSGTSDFDVAADNAGVLHLVFRDSNDRRLDHLSVDSSDEWTLQNVDERRSGGDGATDPATCADGSPIETNEGLGYDPALLVRGSDLLAVYQDRDCGDLRLARRLEDEWAASTVDHGGLGINPASQSGVTGRYPAIAADSSGRLALAYHDVSRSRLVFAFQRNGEFQFEIADSGFEVDEFSQRRKHLVGPFASLVFDNDDVPWIAYMDTTSATMKLAVRAASLESPGEWAQRVVGQPPTGFSTQLAGGVVGAESLRPAESGFSSQLDIIEVEELR